VSNFKISSTKQTTFPSEPRPDLKDDKDRAREERKVVKIVSIHCQSISSGTSDEFVHCWGVLRRESDVKVVMECHVLETHCQLFNSKIPFSPAPSIKQSSR
jgi:hypothetical protein